MVCFGDGFGSLKIPYVRVSDRQATKESMEKIRQQAKEEARQHMKDVMVDNTNYFHNLRLQESLSFQQNPMFAYPPSWLPS